MKYKKRQSIKKMVEAICMMAIAIVPAASGYCRGLFYEEQEPDGYEEFLHKYSHVQKK